MTNRDKLKDLIINTAYFQERIVLSSGKESDYYIDARIVTLNPQGVLWIAEIIVAMIKDENITAFGGPTLGADPMIGAVGVIGAQQGLDFSSFIIRKEPKGHGKQNMIEGPRLKEGDRVVIVDDVATTGKAFVHSLDVLQPLGVEVVKAVCIVDREEGAAEAVAAKGCELHSIFKASEIHQPV